MKKKPLVGITHSIGQSKAALYAMKLAVWQGGGRVMMINNISNKTNYHYDCLLLGGGIDIDPEVYGSSRKPNYAYDYMRDRLEQSHFENAIANQKPILGICRGAQLINVSLGGNLHADIRQIDEKAKYPAHIWGYILFRKYITVKEESLLFKLLKQNRLKVNSLHSQSIHQYGEKLRVTATEDNHIVQAIEHELHPFLLGLQFHPEFMLHRKHFRRIFSEFIREAKK